MRARGVVLGVVLSVVAACDGFVPSAVQTVPSPLGAGVIGPGLSALAIDNGTELTVQLSVNGRLVGSFAPGTRSDPVHWSMPSMPWHVEARTAGGRLLLSYDVLPGGIGRTAGGVHGAGARVDLSCGRLDVWSGPPMAGPAPGPGQSGDCEA
jgi:hypothetical protein